jgi:Flp pilus assembly pilin Flp
VPTFPQIETQRMTPGAEDVAMKRDFRQMGSELLGDVRGTATIEYVIILVLVTIGAAFAIVAIGPSLVELFRVRVLWLSLPFP